MIYDIRSLYFQSYLVKGSSGKVHIANNNSTQSIKSLSEKTEKSKVIGGSV